MAIKPVWTLNQIVQNFDRNDEAWSTSSTIPFAFLNASPLWDTALPDFLGFSQFTNTQMDAVRLIFDLVSDVANLNFVEVSDNHTEPGSSNPRITFSNSSTMGDFWGHTFHATQGVLSNGRSEIDGAEVWVNSSDGIAADYGFGTYDFAALMHETFHGLGLPHPGDYNAGQGIEFTYAGDAAYQQDSWQYTVMSYFGAYNTGAEHHYNYASTPLIHDVAALQHIYGANTNTRTGNTTYGFHSTANRDVFNFAINANPILAIWDAGGTDTLDLSGYSSASHIDLNEGAFSDCAGMTENIAICFGAVIENAVGGSGNDVLIGNAAANDLDGGDGKDTMQGGAGNDTYHVEDIHDAIVETSGSGTDTVLSSVSYTLPDYVEKLTLLGSSALDGTGNNLANTIVGNNAANKLFGTNGEDTLTGNSGDDTLDGGNGADLMSGGAGNDIYFINQGTDIVVEDASSDGRDMIKTYVNQSLGDFIENLTQLGTNPINATGNSLNNIINGNSAANKLNGAGGDDFLRGYDGNDTLNGGSGTDELTGGLGKDTFVFSTALGEGNIDVVTDFSTSQHDVIELDNAVMGALGAEGALLGARFCIGSAAQDSSDHLIYDPTTGALYYDQNGDAAGGVSQIAFLPPGLDLTAADFLVT